jgi:hypothetical protein
MEIMADDGKIFSYMVDESGDNSGYSMYTSQIVSPINSKLKNITPEMIKEIYLMGKDSIALRECNLSKEELIGKYFDRDGNIYYTLDEQVYKFALTLKYFEKLHRIDREGKITYNYPHTGLCIVEFDDGSAAAIDTDRKEILLESGSSIGFFWDVVNRREGTRGWFLKKLKKPRPFSGLNDYKHAEEYNICNP